MSSQFKVASRLSIVLAVLLFASSATGLFLPGVYHDTASWSAQARGVNLVDLLFTLPLLIISLVLARGGSTRARIVLLGVLAYVLYNATIFAFDVSFNALFLIYVAILSLSAFAMVTVISALNATSVPAHLIGTTSHRRISIYLAFIAALFLLAWMKEIVPAILAGATPEPIRQAGVPSNPVYVLDLAFLIPLWLLTAIRVVRGWTWGTIVAGLLLVLNALLGLSIVASTIFQYAGDRSTSLAVVPLFGIIAALSAVLASAHIRGLRYRS